MDTHTPPKSPLRFAYLIVLGLFGLAYLLIIRPLVTVANVRHVLFGAPRDKGVIHLHQPKHRHRVQYDLIDSDPCDAPRQAAQDHVARLAQALDWVALGAQLEDWDRAHAALPSHRRLIHPALDAIVTTLQQGPGPRRCEGLDVARIPDAVIHDAIDAFRADPNRWGLAGLIVRLLASQMWDLRGEDIAQAVREEAWFRIGETYDLALKILDEAQIETRHSSLLYAERLSLLYVAPDADRHVHPWYAAAVKADPGDSAAHMVMGNMMLPRWFGSYEDMETAARQGAAWTSDTMGMAAYAILYNRALEMEPIPVLFMDMELYAEGIHDLIRYRGPSQTDLPELAQFLYDVSHYSYPIGMTEAQDRENWDARMQQMYSLSLKIVEDHLSGIYPPAWADGERGALNMVSRAMGQELSDGLNLVVGPRGVRAVAPDAPPAK